MRYRIVCTEQEPSWADHEHASIKEVGIGEDPQRATRRLTVQDVVNAIDGGDDFYTKGPRTGLEAKVFKVRCTRCNAYRIRSGPDATTDNNLDSLRACQ